MIAITVLLFTPDPVLPEEIENNKKKLKTANKTDKKNIFLFF